MGETVKVRFRCRQHSHQILHIGLCYTVSVNILFHYRDTILFQCALVVWRPLVVTMEIAMMACWGRGPASAMTASEAPPASCVTTNTTGLTAQVHRPTKNCQSVLMFHLILFGLFSH